MLWMFAGSPTCHVGSGRARDREVLGELPPQAGEAPLWGRGPPHFPHSGGPE
jgi:hypothetical protein